VVVTYDDHTGLGEVEAAGDRFWFHCTQLLDGSRHAEPGQPVTFRVVPGLRGIWEAAEVLSLRPDRSLPIELGAGSGGRDDGRGRGHRDLPVADGRDRRDG